jgi:GTP-binding protein
MILLRRRLHHILGVLTFVLINTHAWLIIDTRYQQYTRYPITHNPSSIQRAKDSDTSVLILNAASKRIGRSIGTSSNDKHGSSGRKSPIGKNKKGSNHNTNSALTSTTPPPSVVATSASTRKSSTTSSKSTPPWNVRSPKDALEHVQQEKIRRASIQQQLSNGRSADNSTATLTPSTSQVSSTSATPLLSKVFLSNKEQQFIKWKRFRTSDKVVGQRLLHTFFNQSSMQQQILNNYGVPEIAFIGRSNVGKSSLLNQLSSSSSSSSSSSINNKGSMKEVPSTTMARVGKTPGATASVNMYSLFDNKQKDLIIFTDLPGFGYAKLSKERQDAIIRTTEQYIYQRSTKSKTLALGILLLDIRRTPSQDDIELLETLYDMNVPVLVVVTKCDKVSSKYEREQLILNIQNELQLPQLPLTISSMTGENINLLWQIIFDACETCVEQMKQKYESIDNNNDTELGEDEDVEFDDDEQYSSWYSDQNDTNMITADDEDIVYDQGFDWTNDNVVLESNDYDMSTSSTMNEYNNNNEDDVNNDSVEESDDILSSEPQKRVTLKSLKRRVKKMQRRGEI